MRLIRKIGNMFLDTQGKLERIDAINSQLTSLEATKELLVSQYQDVQKAMSCDEFKCKDDLKFSERDYLRSVAKIKRLEKSLSDEREDLNSDKVVDQIIYDNRRKKASRIIKSLYQSGKLSLDQYNDAVYKDKNGAVLYADVIVTDAQGRFLLLKRSAWEDNHKGAWVIPGGHVDKGETSEEAAIRELREESGINLQKLIDQRIPHNWNHVGTYKDDKANIEYYNLWINDVRDVEIVLDDEESRDYQWTPISEIDNYPMVFNMQSNVKKMMGWDNYPQVKLIRKAIAQGVIPIEKVGDIIKSLSGFSVIEKSRPHKYITKKPDGKGGWTYEYREESSVSKKFNFDIQKIEEYGRRICTGREQLIERLSPEEELGRSKGGRRNVEATALLGADEEASYQDSEHPRDRQLRLLEEYAKLTGCWIEDYVQHFGDARIGGATESEVFKVNDATVAKVNNFEQHEDILEFFDRVALHNFLFPDAPYTVTGFTKRDGSVNVIFEQPFIEGTVGASREQVASVMIKMGFEAIGSNTYVNKDYVVEDLHKNNVFVTEDNRLIFVDPIERLNVEDFGYGGNRTVGHSDFSSIKKSIDELYLTGQMSDEEFGLEDTLRDIEKAKKDLSKLKKIKKFVKKDGKIFLQTFYVKTGETEVVELTDKHFKDVIPQIEDIEVGKEYEVVAGTKKTTGLLVDIAYLEKKDSYYMLISNDEGKLVWRQFDTIKSVKLVEEEKQEEKQLGYTFVKDLGGSTGAKLVKTLSGALMVEKKGASLDHAVSEFEANKLYRRLGVNVPDMAFKDGAIYSDYVDDGKPLNLYFGSSGEKHVLDLARKGFVVDCIMGNWDVAGMDYDNMLYSEKYDRVYRIDVGGSLAYRAQGGLKDLWGEQVTEIDTLRDASTNPTAARIFGDITDAEILLQIQKAYQNFGDISSSKYSDTVKKRLNWLYEEMKRRTGEEALKDQDDMYLVDKDLTPKDIVDFYADVNELMKVTKVDYDTTLDEWMKNQNNNAGVLTNDQKAYEFLKSDFSEEVINSFAAMGLAYSEIAAINLYTGSYYSHINDALSEMTNGKLGNVHFKEGALSHQMIEDVSKKEGGSTYVGAKSEFDNLFTIALSAAKTINLHHANKDQNYNQSKIDAFLTAWNQVQGKLQTDLQPEEKAALTELEAIYTKIEKVRNVSSYDSVPFINYPEIGNTLIDYKTPEVTETKQSKVLKKLEDSGQWRYAAKIMTRGLTKIERSKNLKYLASGQTLRNVKLHGVQDQELFEKQHQYDDYVVHARASSSKKDSSNSWDMTHQLMIMGPPSAYIKEISQHRVENEVLHRPFTLFKCGNTMNLNGYKHVLLHKLV